MQKTVYYSKKFQAMHAADSPQAQANAAPIVVQPSARRTMRLGGIVLIACLAIAILMVALVPMVVGGAAPAASQGARAVATEVAPEHSYVDYPSISEAVAALELRAATPKTLPEGFSLTACKVVDGSILELTLTDGRATVLFRAAAGNDDLSWVDPEHYNHHASETVGSITRSYMGATEENVKVAVWAARSHSYAIVSDLALDAGVMRQLAESIA